MAFKDWLKEKMKEKNWNQVQLAHASGVSQAAICRWLKGEREPDITTLQKIGKTMNIPDWELLLITGIVNRDVFSLEAVSYTHLFHRTSYVAICSKLRDKPFSFRVSRNL